MRRSRRRSRARKKNNPYEVTRHHRIPKNLGGRKLPNNISYVRRYKHEAWHRLFDSLPVDEMVVKLQFYYEVFGTEDTRTREQEKLITYWINQSPSHIKKWFAWRSLFGNMSLKQILSEINRVWIDPRYRLYVQMEQVEKPRISAIRMN